MGKYIGYAVIILIHFLIKGCDYAALEKTNGIVVDHEHFTYGRVYGRDRSTASVEYPVARFIGPTTKRKPDFDYASLSQKEIDSLTNAASLDSFYKYDIAALITSYIEDKRRTPIETNEYLTVEPTGSYFRHHYHLGDSVNVIYDVNNPSDGKIYTFFSFWLKLPAICFILLFCIMWLGIYRLIHKQY